MNLSETTFYAHLELSLTAAAGYAISRNLASYLSYDAVDKTLGKQYFILIGPTLATNILSTGLTAWRAWCAPLASDPP